MDILFFLEHWKLLEYKYKWVWRAAPELRSLAALAVDPSSVPSIYSDGPTGCNSSFRGSDAFFWFPLAVHSHALTQDIIKIKCFILWENLFIL